MKKHEVELIIVGLKIGNEEIVNMKIYKDGTLCRSGCGGMPTFPISGMTLEGSKTYWDKLVTLLDDNITDNQTNYVEENMSNPLEYFIVFYGASDNGETGERANWTKTNGTRFLIDNDTKFRHPLLGFIDNFAIQALQVTNEWFFDIVMMAVYDFKAKGLENTFVTVPKTDAERQEALSRYVNLIMANSPIGWDIVKIGNGRKYKTKDGKELTSAVENKCGAVSINFMEAFGKNDLGALSKRLDEIIKQQDNDPNSFTKPDSKAIKTQNVPKKESIKKWWEFWK